MDLRDVLDSHIGSVRQITPENVLWRHVVLQCFVDAFEASNFSLAEGRTHRLRADSDFDPDAVRAECRRWLVSDLSPWKEQREDVCDMADLDPDDIQRAARKRLTEKPRPVKSVKRLMRRLDVRYEEREADLRRFEQLESLDAEYEARQVYVRARERAATLRARRAAEVAVPCET